MNAFVLAGGRSTRMGRDKALIHINGATLIAHALNKLRTLRFKPVIVGSRPDLARFAPVIPDNYEACGPLGGIEAALLNSSEDLNLFLPVDLPFLPADFLLWMTHRAEQTNALATIPRHQGRPQPLCSIYHRALLPHAQAALAHGDGKVMRAIERAAAATGQRIDTFNVEILAAALIPSAWPQFPPAHRWFDNMNAPHDLQNTPLEQMPRIH